MANGQVIAICRDRSGRPLGGVMAWVFYYDTTDPAVIYSDDGVTRLSNPLRSDKKGRIRFWADDRFRYDVDVRHRDGDTLTGLSPVVVVT